MADNVSIMTMPTATATAAEKKTWIQSYIERAQRDVAHRQSATAMSPHMKEMGSIFRVFVEAGALGALLGAGHATFGLDVGGVPVDGVIAATGALTALAAAGSHPGLAEDARTLGGQAFAIMTFRKTESFLSRRGRSSSSGGGSLAAAGGGMKPIGGKNGAAIHGEIENDPIAKFAERAKGGAK